MAGYGIWNPMRRDGPPPPSVSPAGTKTGTGRFGSGTLLPVIMGVLIPLALISLAAVHGAASAHTYGVEAENLGRYLKPGITATGGEITDGRDLRRIRWGVHPGFERVVLDIYHGSYWEQGPPADRACFFAIELEEYPSRIVITLGGIRVVNADLGIDFRGSRLIEGVHRMLFLDDSGARLALVLGDHAEFRVLELGDPGRIVIDIRPGCTPAEPGEKYSVRSADLSGYEMETAYGQLKDAASVPPRLLERANGEPVMEVDLFETGREAEEMLAVLEKNTDLPLIIEKRGPLDLPE